MFRNRKDFPIGIGKSKCSYVLADGRQAATGPVIFWQRGPGGNQVLRMQFTDLLVRLLRGETEVNAGSLPHSVTTFGLSLPKGHEIRAFGRSRRNW